MKHSVKLLKKNDDIMAVLEHWLKINNSQKSVKYNYDIVEFLKENGKIDFDCEDYHGRFSHLEKYVKANRKMIIVTSSMMFVLYASSLAFDSYSISKVDLVADNIESNIFYVDDMTAHSMIEDYHIHSLKDSIKSPINISLKDYMEMKNKLLEKKIKLEEKQKEKEEEKMKILEEERVKEEKKYIALYCDIYSLNYEKVYQILSNITDDFKDENYINNYVIGDSMMKNKYVVCTSKEMAILIAIRNLYFNPTLYNSPYEDLKSEKEYITELSYSKQIAYIANVLGLDPALSYSICKAESNFNSPMFLNKNNPGGIKFGTTFATFPSKTAGFIEQSLILLSYKISGRETIVEIGRIYAPVPGRKENETEEEKRERELNSEWIRNVTSIYNSSINNYDILFGDVTTISLLKENLTEEEIYIRQYSDIYGLDYEKVYQILSTITNHFESKDYKYAYMIGNSKLDNHFVIPQNKEMAILIAVRNIYYFPEQYGYSSIELKTDISYKSDLDYAKQIAYVSKVLGVDSALNYTIYKFNVNNSMFVVKNNPNNRKLNGSYITFPSSMARFIEETLELLKYQLDGKNPLKEIENILIEDPTKMSEFISTYRYVMKNYDNIFGREEITLNNEKVYVLK